MNRNTRLARWLTFPGAAVLAAAAAGAAKDDKPALDLGKIPPAAAVAVDFARDIKPLLAANCVSCHGPKKHEGGLRLSTKEVAFAGGDGGPVIVPGKGVESRLIHLVAGIDPDEVMPPAKKAKPLTKDQVALLRAWIDQGAKWPDGLAVVDGAISDHWAYKKPVRPELPAVRDGEWARNPIDRFVLAKLESAGLHPSSEASRASLIRRASLDLTGLPATREEVAAFENDPSSDAYEKVVDRLLASPHYGERWALPWLDLARYADSNGYEKDRIRSMWPYRDWVINALNRDVPFDQFTVEQLAGDLLPNATTDQKIATGFNRNTTLNEEGGVDEHEYYFYSVVDRVSTTATVWLGTTLACAQCHSHKYDPLSHKDYYRFFAYFNSTAEETAKRGGIEPKDVSARLTVETPELAAMNTEHAALKSKLDAPSPEIDAAQVKWEDQQAAPLKTTATGPDEKPAAPRRNRPAAAALPPNVTALLAVSRDQRDEKQQKTLAAYYRTIAPELQSLRKQADDLRAKIDAYPKTALVMQELPQPRETFLHIRGGFQTLGEKVEPGIPAVFAGSAGEGTPSASQPQNRLDLARWLVSRDNPLTARVTVNRMWEQYFGVGIVKTSEDFGTQGEPPSNQALLDWLACEFQSPSDGGRAWGMKAMHRMIVTSAAYRQSSRVTPELLEKDPYNRLLARGPRFRLPAELLRDQALAVSGLLSRKLGGPSVFPLQPEGVWKTPYSGDKWQTSDGEDRFRRGVYTFHRRSAPYPAFMAFDKTTLEASCTRRSRTDTPLQALTTLNDPVYMQAAAALARRVVTEAGGDADAKAAFAVRTVLARQPDPAEVRRLASLYDQMRRDYEKNPAAAKMVAESGLPNLPKDVPPAELAAWTMVSNVLLNLDETVTKE